MRKLLIAVTLVGLSAAPVIAADIAARPYTKAPVAPSWSWTGSYIGGYVGGATKAKDAFTSPPVLGTGVIFNGDIPTSYGLGSSFIGGLTSGYNWQVSLTGPHGVVRLEC